MKNLLLAVVAAATVSSVVLAEGLEVGSNVAAFYVNDVTGPSAGKKLCYRCQYGNAPVVSIFTRDVDGNVASLIKEVDKVVGTNQSKKMAAFVVLLTDDPEAKSADLKKVAADQGVTKTPLTTFDGTAGPANYKISQDAEVTVMMWVGGQLKVNKSFKEGELTADKIPSILGETKAILN